MKIFKVFLTIILTTIILNFFTVNSFAIINGFSVFDWNNFDKRKIDGLENLRDLNLEPPIQPVQQVDSKALDDFVKKENEKLALDKMRSLTKSKNNIYKFVFFCLIVIISVYIIHKR